MKIYHEIPANDGTARVLAIGFFDGFHRGHAAIVRALLRERHPGMRAAALTFRNHPIAFLRPGEQPPLIATLEGRVNALATAGIDDLYLIPFDAAIATLDPAAFLDRIVCDAIGAQAVVVGENFRFGAKRAGDVAFAAEHLAARDVRFVAVPNLADGDDRVSSTRIRAALLAGQTTLAEDLLGHPYVLRGVVELGAGRGHDLGFPTANLRVAPDMLIPADGVYAATARHDGRDYGALVSIGTNPTFDGTVRTVEVWVRDFELTIYGEELSVRDLVFLREQRRYDSIDALLEQMRADVAAVPYPSPV